ncbi:HAMP domain-containing histidine kinase [Cryobacterium sp. PAMC25264]|nr:HAMP domain-containing histidine kinase [Cryobacterium sp. PAMC25264]
MTTRAAPLDADARLVRNASRRVGVTITVAVSTLVVAVLAAALSVVFTQIPLDVLFSPGPHETAVDIDGVDVIVWGVIVGMVAISLAAIVSVFVTRRAVAPLVDALRRQRRFVADASHELRTPLAVADARIQLLARSLSPDDPHRELVEEIHNDSRALAGVVADLLDSIDVSPAAAVSPISVDRAVHAAVSAMRMIAKDRGVQITLTPIAADVVVAIPETSLHRSLVALIDNAIKHSPQGRSITLAVSCSRDMVRIDVADQGPGIQGISADRVFDRFARSAQAVDGGGTASTGFGIGLSLVQDTVSRYGGSATVTTTSASGTTITLQFPRPPK